MINIDIQKAYTCVGQFATAYETDPDQIAYVNELTTNFFARPQAVRLCGPTSPSCNPARTQASGVRGATRRTRCKTSKLGRRAKFDDRCTSIGERDVIINKRMASAFLETNLRLDLQICKVDTVMVTGGSTSGCVRATVVDSLQRSFRTIVPIECVADKHESPHFANLYDMALKYADVVPVQ